MAAADADRLTSSEPGYFWRRPSLPRSWTFSTRYPGSSGDTVATMVRSRQSLRRVSAELSSGVSGPPALCPRWA
jgi:hypothetical protein